MSASGPIAVIGAGIAGVSTAVWLARSGADVILIDRQEPGEATSFGNGGVLAACAIVPVTVPGLMRKAPGMLMDPDSPLFLRWPYLPKLLLSSPVILPIAVPTGWKRFRGAGAAQCRQPRPASGAGGRHGSRALAGAVRLCLPLSGQVRLRGR
ncbi:FAD-dependent oxidoreductase [Pannonibacter sp. Pt2-lr]